MTLPPDLAFLLIVLLALGVVLAWIEMLQPNYPKYRKGCHECAVAEGQAKEAEKRRQEQLRREWEEKFLPPQASGAGRGKRCGRPPKGWHCTREPGHDGPCAAVRSSGGWMV